MTYTYAYKSSDGIRHEAKIEAPSREAVFETLRERGIRAIKVVAADGSKANGEVRGVRKRVVAIGALCIVLCAIAAAIVTFRAGDARNLEQVTRLSEERSSLAGDLDPEVLKRLESSGLKVDAINDLLEARRRINEEYRNKLEAAVERGELTRKAANDLLQAAGL